MLKILILEYRVERKGRIGLVSLISSHEFEFNYFMHFLLVNRGPFVLIFPLIL